MFSVPIEEVGKFQTPFLTKTLVFHIFLDNSLRFHSDFQKKNSHAYVQSSKVSPQSGFPGGGGRKKERREEKKSKKITSEIPDFFFVRSIGILCMGRTTLIWNSRAILWKGHIGRYNVSPIFEDFVSIGIFKHYPGQNPIF